MNCLFIGGPHDGEWHDVPIDGPCDTPRGSWCLQKSARVERFLTPSEFVAHGLLRTNTQTRYVAQKWQADKRPRWVYTLPEMDGRMAFDMLLDGYRRP